MSDLVSKPDELNFVKKIDGRECQINTDIKEKYFADPKSYRIASKRFSVKS
jgi:hypothetical protein